jgi:sulfur-carrier protein
MVSKAAEGAHTVRVVLPFHLRMLGKITGEIQLEVQPPITQRAVLDALEARYPMLTGTTRDHVTQRRRAYLRFYACEQDLSLEEPDTPLPEAVAAGDQPFLIIGAIAGG